VCVAAEVRFEERVVSASAGIHHVTAICRDPANNVAFYTGNLGLRLVKRTVNFDDPSTLQLYYVCL
jgi:glyoxalase family protein